MKVITYSFGSNLDWTVPLSEKLEGKIKDNSIIPSKTIATGDYYFLDCTKGIAAYYVDANINMDLNMIQKNQDKDFVGMYYNLTPNDIHLSSNHFSHYIGHSAFNFFIVDSRIKTNSFIKAGTRTFELCIFIKKDLINAFFNENNISYTNIKAINPLQNNFSRFDRMSIESYHLLNDLRKLKVTGPVFDLNLNATVHLLVSNYLKKIITQKTIIQNISEADLSAMIALKQFMLDNIEGHFPSIKLMADKANMSQSKFQKLFKEITGFTPNSYFMNNKLLRAKELLEENELSVTQISDYLNFTNSSHFASKFKKYFGILPKTFIKEL